MPQLSPLTLFLPNTNQLARETHRDVRGPKPFVDLLRTASKIEDIKEGFAHLLDRENYCELPHHNPLWYRMSTSKDSFDGFLCGLSSTVFQKGGVSTHEHVLDKRVELFRTYLHHTQLQAEPLLLLHEADDFALNFSTAVMKRSPNFTFLMDNTTHELWTLTASEVKVLSQFAKSQKQFHLADGHHRLASSLKHLEQQPKKYPIQSFVMAKDSIYKGGFYWKIKQLEGFDSFKQRLSANSQNTNAPDLLIHTKNKTFAIESPPDINPAVFAFKHLLNFTEESEINLKAIIDYSPISHSHKDPIEQLDPYVAILAFRPLHWDEILNTAKSGGKLPPKSTYLLPKLPTGLLVSPI